MQGSRTFTHRRCFC